MIGESRERNMRATDARVVGGGNATWTSMSPSRRRHKLLQSMTSSAITLLYVTSDRSYHSHSYWRQTALRVHCSKHHGRHNAMKAF